MIIGSSIAHTNAGTLFVYHHDAPDGNHTSSGLSRNFLALTAPALKPLLSRLPPQAVADVIEPRSRSEMQPGSVGHEYPGSAKYSHSSSSTSLHEQGVWDAGNVAKAMTIGSPSDRRSSTDSRESSSDIVDISDLLKSLPRIATPPNAFKRLDEPAPEQVPFPEERHQRDLIRQARLEALIDDLRARTETVQQRREAGLRYLATRAQTQPVPIPRPTRAAPQFDRPYGRPPLGRNSVRRYTPESPIIDYLLGTNAHVVNLLSSDRNARPVRRSQPTQKREGSVLENQRFHQPREARFI